jgi:hypothetical protein
MVQSMNSKRNLKAKQATTGMIEMIFNPMLESTQW